MLRLSGGLSHSLAGKTQPVTGLMLCHTLHIQVIPPKGASFNATQLSSNKILP